METKTTRFTKQQLEQVRNLTKGRCFYCGAFLGKKRGIDWHADHFLPHEQGGTDDLLNRVASCISCNVIKCNFSLEQLRVFIRQRAVENTAKSLEYIKRFCWGEDLKIEQLLRLTEEFTEGVFSLKISFWGEALIGGFPDGHTAKTTLEND